jgi:hypothetical protein
LGVSDMNAFGDSSLIKLGSKAVGISARFKEVESICLCAEGVPLGRKAALPNTFCFWEIVTDGALGKKAPAVGPWENAGAREEMNRRKPMGSLSILATITTI